MLRLLVDENLGKSVVDALRREGFHVQFVTELMRGASDEEVARRAREEGKILVTQDKDFGRIAVAHGLPGLLLIRIRGRQEEVIRALLAVLRREIDLYGHITVVEKGRIRRRSLI